MRVTFGSHSFDLEPGRSYLASRPMAARPGEMFTVTITCLDTQQEVAWVPNLPYDAANNLLALFNADPYAGRYLPDFDITPSRKTDRKVRRKVRDLGGGAGMRCKNHTNVQKGDATLFGAS